MEDSKSENKYNPSDIEAKWQKVWEDEKIFSPDIKAAKNPYFNLMMFPYPSAEGLHVGNMYAFTGADVYAKFQRMQGKDVLEPIGLDGFGIHSENYALKIGKHPKEQAEIAEKNFYRQMRSIGNSFDWQRTVETYDPNYYKWTQWLFITLFKAGLAYRATALVNWCPRDLTVLSDEQVIDGCCERCGTKVEKKNLEQWFFRITNYARRLLDNIKDLDWSNNVKIAQTNWIGRSEGAEIEFAISDELKTDEPDSVNREQRTDYGNITIFTTRPDTLYGATFMVVAPEHSLVEAIFSSQFSISKENEEEVRKYVEKAKNKTEVERTGEGKEKTGVFSGLYAINPVNNEKIPVWVADYVLSGYGTGAIMAVPAHDERDFAFAKKYRLPIIPVIASEAKQSSLDLPYIGPGILTNSKDWDGIEVPKNMFEVLDSLEGTGIGTRRANYHLRDWLISRQRYWGPPIPMIFCSTCQKNDKAEVSGMEGWFSVPEADLPVLLPEVSDWKPMGTGKSPLANHSEFYKTTCPSCGGEATRETDVSDTFLDSAWYFLRYPSTDIENAPFDIDITKKWLPVNMYIGGAEHAVLHLLYSRFITMVLHDLGYLNFEEPFSKLFAHGLIIKDGAKMSKSKGNVVVPDEYISKYGADTLRAYLMFIGPYSDGGDFSDSGIEGMNKFLRKVWKLLQPSVILSVAKDLDSSQAPIDNDRTRMLHKTIQKVTKDIETFSYNTAIASLMEWYNFLSQEVRNKNQELSSNEKEVYLKLLAPFAPYLTEEIWQETGDRRQGAGFSSIHLSSWPEYDADLATSSDVIIAIQVNGKTRGTIELDRTKKEDQEQVEKLAKVAVTKYLEGKNILKTIYIPGKILNFVVEV